MAGPFAQSRGDESVASLLSAMRSVAISSKAPHQPAGDAIIGDELPFLPSSFLPTKCFTPLLGHSRHSAGDVRRDYVCGVVKGRPQARLG